MFIRNQSTLEGFRIQTELKNEFLKKAKSVNPKMNFSEAVRAAIVFWINEK